MREIQAPRAWYKPLGTMIQPEEVESINFETKVIGVYMQMDGKGFHRLRLSDFEVMRPTGLKDRNGQEIYDRDIQEGGPYDKEVKVICYDSKQARFKAVPLSLYKANAGNGGWTGYDVKDYEVIGNIWEHPHLLKEA